MSNTITPTVFYRTLNVEGLEAKTMESLRWRVLNSIKESFPTQSSIFSTRAISRWKKKWIGLGR